jgi:excinuclease UvrABC ATPase subunit
MRYEGALTSMMRRMRETQSEEMRQYYQRFLSNLPCSMCGGKRVQPEALGVRVGGLNIAEATATSVEAAYRFFDELALKGAEATIATELLKEIRSRLRFLRDHKIPAYIDREEPEAVSVPEPYKRILEKTAPNAANGRRKGRERREEYGRAP